MTGKLILDYEHNFYSTYDAELELGELRNQGIYARVTRSGTVVKAWRKPTQKDTEDGS